MFITKFEPATEGFSPLVVSTIDAHDKSYRQAYAWAEAYPSRRNIKRIYSTPGIGGHSNLLRFSDTFTKAVATLIDPQVNLWNLGHLISSFSALKTPEKSAFYVLFCQKNSCDSYNYFFPFVVENLGDNRAVLYLAGLKGRVIKKMAWNIFERDFSDIITTDYHSKSKEAAFKKHFADPPPSGRVEASVIRLNYPRVSPKQVYTPVPLEPHHYFVGISPRARVYLLCIILCCSIVWVDRVYKIFLRTVT